MSGRMGMILTSGYQRNWPSVNGEKTTYMKTTSVIVKNLNVPSDRKMGKPIDFDDLMKSKPCKSCN